MQRRDAIDELPAFPFHRADRRTLSAFAVAVGVHAALLAALSVGVFRSAPPAELVMVSLIAAGGSGPTQAAPAPAAPPAVEPLRPLAPPKLARARRQRVAPPVAHPPSPAFATETTGQPLAHSAGNESMAGVGGGSGLLGGSGTGSGVGSGDGAGAGDQRARCIVCPEPNYPLIARRRGWQGTVEVGLSLLPDGTVAAADVRRSSGYEVLDREAVTVARRSRFTPLVAGPAHGRIAYRFELTPSQP